MTTRDSIATHNLPRRQRGSVLRNFGVFASDIKIQHTVFAMPWALLSAVLAGRRRIRFADGMGKIAADPDLHGHRPNRGDGGQSIARCRLDAQNPRTARRAIPAGSLSSPIFVAAAGDLLRWIFIAGTPAF